MRYTTQAALTIAPPPCEKFNCPSAQRCKSEKLACHAFAYYAETGRALAPQVSHSVRIGQSHRATLGDRIEPTAELYRGLFSDSDKPINTSRKQWAQSPDRLRLGRVWFSGASNAT